MSGTGDRAVAGALPTSGVDPERDPAAQPDGPELVVVSLYSDELNTYGDRGNLLALVRRARARGLAPRVHHHHPGAPWPARVHAVLAGGGEDASQGAVAADLAALGPVLRGLVDDGVPVLTVCGSYQLFGRRYTTGAGAVVPGIGVFDAETTARPGRLVGNASVDASADGLGVLHGFENHGGRTALAAGQAPLGRVTKGSGNDGADGTEGARTHHAVGTYLHGPVLALNPALADAMVSRASELATGAVAPPAPAGSAEDRWAGLARAAAAARRA